MSFPASQGNLHHTETIRRVTEPFTLIFYIAVFLCDISTFVEMKHI